ncbi:DUF6082 family protein [Nocardia pseudovaccinii]|uniref:DUF6082 family protein n=1 Tax=Nocardia pseudovaccinii TaxID=189540 RepID=UPI000B1FFCF5|nr:DUF6082 family protein [Nocardia pseudovaccinii]
MSIASRRPASLHWSAGWLGHRITRHVALGVTVVTGVVAVLLSPFLLLLLPTANSVDWGRLREVSQAYGATSTIVSALALCGVATSLFLQTQQFKASRYETVRRYQLDLNRIALEDPTIYGPCIGRLVEPPGIEARQFYYAAAWMRYGLMAYESGVVSERSLREDLFGDVFRSDIGRDYWSQTGALWGATMASYNHRTRAFKRIADEEYRKAVAAGPAPITWGAIRASQQTASPQEMSNSRERTKWLTSGFVALTISAGVALGVVIGKSNVSHFGR